MTITKTLDSNVTSTIHSCQAQGWIPIHVLQNIWQQNNEQTRLEEVNKVRIAIQPYNQYVKGELVINYKKVKHLFKHDVNVKVQNGNDFCTKTGLTFVIKHKGETYILRDWVLSMVEKGAIKTKLLVA
jgi:hypothetical protein